MIQRLSWPRGTTKNMTITSAKNDVGQVASTIQYSTSKSLSLLAENQMRVTPPAPREKFNQINKRPNNSIAFPQLPAVLEKDVTWEVCPPHSNHTAIIHPQKSTLQRLDINARLPHHAYTPPCSWRESKMGVNPPATLLLLLHFPCRA